MSYNLTIEEKNILITQRSSRKVRCLKISYQFKIEELQINYPPQMLNSSATFHAILGIKVIKNIPFFVVVKEHEMVCTFQGSQLYEIKSIDWIPITNQLQKLQNPDVEQQLNDISKIFEQGLHYYSDSYQLWKPFTLNYTQNSQSQSKYYEQFVWNSNIIKIDIQSQYMNALFGESKNAGKNYYTQQQVFSQWCTPIIQGYVSLYETILPDDMKLQYMLVSRRSCKKAGTRFFSRGIDDQGNVANYTESQFIVQYGDLVMSNIQLRGSVPVFFQQIGVQGINIELNIQRTKQLTKKPFTTHFTSILQHYHRCMCVNLLSEHKKSEQKLSNFYEQMIAVTKPYISDLRYQFFDFHEECKNNEFHHTQKLITKITEVIKAFGFSCYNLSSKKVVKKQSGVFRTNCLDCLDRTNYVQSRIALQTLKQMLKQFASAEVKKNVIQYGLLKHVDVEMNSQLLNLFNLLWAQNGDSVSLHYTGIGSTHTDITKVGKRTLFGTVNHKMRSLMRFYTQFTDVKKHETINTFLGNKSLLKFDYTQGSQRKTKQENILVMSWQFSDPERALTQFEKNPYNSKTYQFLLNQLKQSMGNKHVMIVLFLYVPNELVNWQSGVNFDIKNFLNPFKSSFADVINKWGDFVTTQLGSGKQKYVLIDSNTDYSCKMLIFCKHNQMDSVTNIKKDQITSSLKTKEVVLLTKFKFHESPLVFQGFNVKNMDSFCDFIEKVNEKGFQQKVLGRSKSTSVNQQSYRLILGNVGSESTLPQVQYNNLLANLAEQQKIFLQKAPNKPILSSHVIANMISRGCEYDQLKKLLQSTKLMSQKKIKVLANYNQAPLEFIPQNNRILFWNEEGKIVRARTYKKIQQSVYGDLTQNLSISRLLMGKKQKGISMCYPNCKEEMQKQVQSCVYLELSYQIEEIFR